MLPHVHTGHFLQLIGAQDDETASASIAARLGSNPFVVEHSSMPDHYALLADKARISRTRRSSAASSAAVQHAADAAAGAAASIHGGGALPGAGVDRGNGLNTEGTPGPEHTNRLKGSSLHNASVLPKKPKPLEGLVYATDQVWLLLLLLFVVVAVLLSVMMMVTITTAVSASCLILCH